jgi:hypothetical protein
MFDSGKGLLCEHDWTNRGAVSLKKVGIEYKEFFAA